MLHDGSSRRVAIVGGTRIPFCRAHSVYTDCSNQDMMTATLEGLVQKFDLKGQTLGMQAWRIRLRSIDEAQTTISLRQALLRCAGALVSLLPLGAGYWWCLVDRHGRYWHDYLSGTELELLPKEKK